MIGTDINSTSNKNMSDVIHYYNACWLKRFNEGHNPNSYAIHLGLFRGDSTDNDLAKLETNRFLVEELGIPTNNEIRIADFGCGVGGTCFFLASNFNKAHVYGINISKEQILFAQRVSRRMNIERNLIFLNLDFHRTDLASSSLDYVLAVESIFHSNSKSLVFSEAYRVLDKNGVFAFLDYFQVRPVRTLEEKSLLSKFNSGWGALEFGTGVICAHEFDYESELKKIGFVSVSSKSLTNLVYKGVVNSYQKALIKLKNDVSMELKNHYDACLALKALIDLGLIDYRFVVSKK